MKKLKTRKFKLKDYNRIVEIQKACFPNMAPWTPQQFQSLISTFPEGQILIEYDGKVVASSCSHIINFSAYSETSSWKELTNDGFITNHNPKGDTLYGIEI